MEGINYIFANLPASPNSLVMTMCLPNGKLLTSIKVML